MSDRIHALHPDPSKRGVTIDATKYHMVREAIEVALAHGPIAFTGLIERTQSRLGEGFDGSVPWYVTTVKLDLEARGVIERVPKQTPQHLRLTASG